MTGTPVTPSDVVEITDASEPTVALTPTENGLNTLEKAVIAAGVSGSFIISSVATIILVIICLHASKRAKTGDTVISNQMEMQTL